MLGIQDGGCGLGDSRWRMWIWGFKMADVSRDVRRREKYIFIFREIFFLGLLVRFEPGTVGFVSGDGSGEPLRLVENEGINLLYKETVVDGNWFGGMDNRVAWREK